MHVKRKIKHHIKSMLQTHFFFFLIAWPLSRALLPCNSELVSFWCGNLKAESRRGTWGFQIRVAVATMIYSDWADQKESQSLAGIMNNSSGAGYMSLPRNKARRHTMMTSGEGEIESCTIIWGPGFITAQIQINLWTFLVTQENNPLLCFKELQVGFYCSQEKDPH